MKFLKKLFINDKAFYRKVLILALPIALQSLITTGVNLLDNMMLGRVGADLVSEYEEEFTADGIPEKYRYIEKEVDGTKKEVLATVPEAAQFAAENVSSNSLAAAANSNSFIGIYQILCMGLGMGASVLVSRYWGMKQKADAEARKEDADDSEKALKKTVALMLRFAMGLALLFAVSTFFFSEGIMGIFIKSDNLERAEIMSRGIEYLKYSSITYFFTGASLVTTIVLRSVGSALYPLFVSIGALLVNLVGNYMLIFGKFGAPRLEVKGAAIATLIARVFECTCILIYLFIIDQKMRFRVKNLFMSCRSLLGEYFRVCFPVLVSDGILAIGNFTFSVIIGRLGYTAANGITANTQQLSTVAVQGVCQAGAIITGQTLGLGDRERTQKQGWAFLGLGLILGTISAGIIFFFSSLIIGSYKVTVNDKEIARQLMDAISLIIIFQATNSIMTKGVLRGGGDTMKLMIMDNVFLWCIALPLGAIVGFVFHWSPFLIYICLKSDQIIKAVWCVLRLQSGKWIKKVSTGNRTANS